jgi:hypothetical protein
MMRSNGWVFERPTTVCSARITTAAMCAHLPRRRSLAALCLLAANACSSTTDVATGNATGSFESTNTQANQVCRPQCTIAVNANFYATTSDSANSPTVLGYARLTGDSSTSAVVRVRLAPNATVAQDDSALITVDGLSTARITVRDLARGVSIRPLISNDTVLVAVLLTTRRRGASGGGELVLESDATVLESTSTSSGGASRSAPEVALNIGSNSSALGGSEGSFRGTSWQISPYANSDTFFGTFQSSFGTGASTTIEITFSQPITSITVTAIDPTWAGNRMYASGPNSVEQVNFEQSNQPGLLVRSTRRLVGDFTLVRLQPAPGDYVLYSASFTVGDESFAITCVPATVTRGQEVTCSAEVTPAKEFTIVSRAARTLDTLNFMNAEPFRTSVSVQNGVARHEWRGVAAASSMVTFTASVAASSGATNTLTDSASFLVSPRTWAELNVADPKVVKTQLMQQFAQYPSINGATLGLHGLEYINALKGASVTLVSSGPNRGLAILSAPIRNLTSRIWMHPGLYNNAPSKEWFAQQNGIDTVPNPIGSGFVKRCNATQFTVFRSMLERHEGVSLDLGRSHWGLWVSWIASQRLQSRFESLVVAAPNAAAVRTEAYILATDVLYPIQGQQNPTQAAFDSTDYPKIPAELVASQNCFPYFYP